MILNATTSCRVIELIITQDYLNSINYRRLKECWNDGFAVDILSQPSTTMTGIEVATLEHDLQPPSLSEYTFDLNSGIFTLNFTVSIS